MKDLTPITPEALIEMGFVNSHLDEYTFYMNGNDIEVYREANFNIVAIILGFNRHVTNATTIEDIKDLIRLFK